MIDQENMLKVLQDIFPTKVDLDNFKDEMRESNNKVLTSNDKLVKKLTHIETEITSFHGGQMRQDETLVIARSE